MSINGWLRNYGAGLWVSMCRTGCERTAGLVQLFSYEVLIGVRCCRNLEELAFRDHSTVNVAPGTSKVSIVRLIAPEPLDPDPQGSSMLGLNVAGQGQDFFYQFLRTSGPTHPELLDTARSISNLIEGGVYASAELKSVKEDAIERLKTADRHVFTGVQRTSCGARRC